MLWSNVPIYLFIYFCKHLLSYRRKTTAQTSFQVVFCCHVIKVWIWVWLERNIWLLSDSNWAIHIVVYVNGGLASSNSWSPKAFPVQNTLTSCCSAPVGLLGSLPFSSPRFPTWQWAVGVACLMVETITISPTGSIFLTAVGLKNAPRLVPFSSTTPQTPLCLMVGGKAHPVFLNYVWNLPHSVCEKGSTVQGAVEDSRRKGDQWWEGEPLLEPQEAAPSGTRTFNYLMAF